MQVKFPFQLFLTTLKIALAASTLCQTSQKIFVAESIHIIFQTSKYIWKLKKEAGYSVVYSTIEVFLHSRSRKHPPQVFCKKGVLKNFANFTGKNLRWSFFSINFQVVESHIKFQVFRPVTLLKRDSDTGAFLWILRNFLKHPCWRTSVTDCFWRSGCFRLMLWYCFLNDSSATNMFLTFERRK